MAKKLRILILEDKPADAELIERELRRAGIIFTSRIVEGKREFSKALADFQPQVILSDFKLPTFNGFAALEIARLRTPDTPFIFISGSIGEEKAIETLAQGASDYIFKNNLGRLGPAVKRVIEATRLKMEKGETDEKMRRHVEELRLLAEAADRFVHINDLDELYDYLAQMIHDISGADYLILSLYDEQLQAVRPKIVSGFEPFQETIRRRFHIDPMQMVFYLKDMRQDDFSDFVSRRLMPVRDGFYGLSNRKMPRAICSLIEKILSIGSMHTMGFSWENQLFGGLTVFFKNGNELKNASQIEAMLNLATVAIKRLLAEKTLRASEEQIRAALREKEVLLQEIHHRVKNNLQIISSLMTLQSDQADRKSLDEIFQESQDRIRSIALIHEKLYHSQNLAEIDFSQYLHALTENLFISHGIAAGRITAKYKMESVLFTIEKAIPLGLIVNELITNALKHAFPAGRQGEICITLHECRDKLRRAPTGGLVPTDQDRAPTDQDRASTFELIVADNGVGLPPDFEPHTQKSLGMNLVSMLTRQLGGSLKASSQTGTEFRITFPKNQSKNGGTDAWPKPIS